MSNIIFTIGHSTHSQEHLMSLLRMHKITAVGDVRSRPYSRNNPQFNREQFKDLLRSQGVSYVFLGCELGARSADPSCYENGRVQYSRLAKTELFRAGIERVISGTQRYRIALMCAEREPLHCHRTILVARFLVEAGIEVDHIHADGHIEDQSEALRRLMSQLGIKNTDMFLSQGELEARAYEEQEDRIAYRPGQEDGMTAGDIVRHLAI